MSHDDGFVPPAAGREAGPPRYVPTLTEVVSVPPAPVAPTAPDISPPLAEPWGMADAVPESPVWDDAPLHGPEPVPLGAPDDEERLLRVLQRVEVLLDRRLSLAVAQAAESVSREFAQRLKSDMEPLIREAVSEAMAEELNPTNHPPV